MARLRDLGAAVQRFADPYIKAAYDRTLARLVDESAAQAWRRTTIRVDTGALKSALTRTSDPNRVLDHRKGEITITILHPAVGHHPEYVPTLPWRDVFTSAWRTWLARRRART